MLYRSFIAFELPDEIKEYCLAVQKSLASKGVTGKWIKPENMHITVNFMDNRSHEDLLTIAESIKALHTNILRTIHFSKISPFVQPQKEHSNFRKPEYLRYMSQICFEITGFKIFGSSYKVLTLELDDINKSATKIVNEILAANKLENDHPSWIPHLTLARFKKREDKRSLKKVDLETGLKKIRFSPTDLTVFTSKNTQSAPIYTKVKT